MVHRKNYSRVPQKMELPNLLEIQIQSYHAFLQQDVPPRLRKNAGLHGAFLSLFPVTDVKGYYLLEYEGYRLGVPKYTLKECKERGMTFAAPLKVDMSLHVFELDGETKKFVEKITNEVYIGEIPLMTDRGTFVINGAERVIVSQLHRSPGITFDEVTHPTGKTLLTSRIIPQRGSWVELILDQDNILWVNIDRRKKMPATVLLRALGYSLNEDIMALFFEFETLPINNETKHKIIRKVVAETIFNTETGEIIIGANEVVSEEKWQQIVDTKITQIKILKSIAHPDNLVIRNTLAKDETKSEEEALFFIYATMRPGPPPNVDTARTLVQRLFFDDKRYDLGDVGRYRINTRLRVTPPENCKTLTKEDFVEAIKYMVKLSVGDGFIDDIDHLGNRRVRSVGELLTAQISVGLTRMVRTIKERLSIRDTEHLVPQDLINARTVSTVIQAFFGSSQLSQFLDQTNPLSELTHKRRVSALGPGGLTRERAGFEVRDVHHTHYGRLCPIETPEGPNIGLIASLSTFARVNGYGFIETPYQRVEEGRLTGKIDWLTADEEDNHYIVPADEKVDEKGNIINQQVFARFRSDYPVVPKTDITYMDISPMQMVSIAAGLIPFLEHDDANRALMGSNMQRQAVPLMVTEAPLIGTGLELRSAIDSGCLITAKNEGVVEKVDAQKIVVRKTGTDSDDILGLMESDVYELVKYERSNQDTCINQRICVKAGQQVKPGDILADGHATKNGELALGRNAMVAYMPWRGYNYEDAIIVSEKIVADDVYTSIHIVVFETEVRDTKRGPEELTREIPNVSEEAVKNLDENGIVRIGTEVEAGDILVGKVTPKGETELSPEERLLRAIFGEKAGDVRDSSLKAPPGLKGTVIDTHIYSRKDRDKKSKKKDKDRIDQLKAEIGQKIVEIEQLCIEKLSDILDETTANDIANSQSGDIIVQKGKKWKKALVKKLDIRTVSFKEGLCNDPKKNKTAEEILFKANDLISKYEDKLDKEIDKIVRGDELKPGVLQLVKVYVAKKRKLSVGDKMAGRHGNKGVISKIVPLEDLPFLPDGTHVDIILNPLGVPSRMNVGQILECHMGLAAQAMDLFVSTPVFDGATDRDVVLMLKEAGLPPSGKSVLRDGRTGEPFDHEVTVGPAYMMKLCHLVDDKIHARSIGPYSLVTQQPLGGKSQFGGQRFGEMEVWALEAYGAAYTLQQILTVKSDDITGRSRIYEAIVKGENSPRPGIPESFNVLVREIKALALDIQLHGDEEE
ncbi:MAG: DNA-directed RNA polymerase subunit beta [Chitinivibrionales bacterium]|nr:DNA-directed RNA polymerase subunit beta [Chitinivibrionales bacterium]